MARKLPAEPQTAYDRLVAEGKIAGPTRRMLMAQACPVPDKERLEQKGQQTFELEAA